MKELKKLFDQNYEKQKKISKIFDINKKYKYKFKFDRNNNKHIIEVFDTKGKLLLRSNYENIGIYNNLLSNWYWGWNISMIDKNLIKNNKKLKDEADKIKNNYEDYNSKEADILHYYLDNGNFMIQPSNIPYIIKIAMYYLKSDWFLAIRKGVDNQNSSDDKNSNIIEYISLHNISKIG